jgi:hypothetical protein
MKSKAIFFPKDEDGVKLMATYIATLEKECVAYLAEDTGSGWTVEVTGY